MWNWLNTYAPAVQAITAILAVFTAAGSIWLAWSAIRGNEKLRKEAVRQATAAELQNRTSLRVQDLATRPLLNIYDRADLVSEDRQKEGWSTLEIKNVGLGPAFCLTVICPTGELTTAELGSDALGCGEQTACVVDILRLKNRYLQILYQSSQGTELSVTVLFEDAGLGYNAVECRLVHQTIKEADGIRPGPHSVPPSSRI